MKAILDWAIRYLTRQYEALDAEDVRAEQGSRHASSPSLCMSPVPSQSRH